MQKTLQIRNVPPGVHRTLATRAAAAGMSLSEYLLKQLTEMARQPTLEEVLARIQQREPVAAAIDTVKAVRAERDSRR